ncbi:MAG TPA: phenylacetate--CoA ligase family protein [Alphaproteobacteria bacterium]|nr:phenylacetate--CoA ligase family protein [Alphaproteobacteria bacterium]
MLTYQDLLRSFHQQLMESQYWSADRLRDYQHEQLEHLLRHARANSPFYATRLDPVFRGNGTIDFERWRDLPLLKREDLGKHRDAMLANNVPPHHGEARDFMTSGSSGVPVTIRANGIAALAAQAAEYRAFDWHAIDYSAILCSIVNEPGVAVWPEGRRRGPWGPQWAYGSSAGRKVEISFFETYPHMLDFIKRSEASYLVTGATVAHALALEAERLDLGIRLDRVMTYGSNPTEAGKDAYRRAFGAGMLPRYSSKEANGIAHTCPSGEHYHVHAENILVEVLNAAGEPCAPGETGTVVVTPFLSTHQPIIRYELGDLATVGGPCSCGRTLPVLTEIAGRISHVFRFPDGTSTYRRLPQSLRGQLKAGMWQIAQVEPMRIELRYQPLDWNEYGDEDGVVDFMRTLYPDGVEIVPRRVERFTLTNAGKLIEYVYEVET